MSTTSARASTLARLGKPGVVKLHIGPTGSGKTYGALQRLAEVGEGYYAAPLRMIAQEAWRKLSQQLGEDQVGLLTGEERINEHAPIICCTAEIAPLSGRLLVVDEAHWVADPERGPAWTRLLALSRHEELIVCSSGDAVPLLVKAFPDAEWNLFDRKVPLRWVGEVDARHEQLITGTIVVTFSRKMVLELASRLGRSGYRTGALYGAMPPAARRLQIDRFLNGDLDIIVSTDVIGHGVNLPCEQVLFAETTKFDGKERRDLHDWEAAQIAGRAGRFGLSSEGRVGILKGISDWLNPSPKVARKGLTQPQLLETPGGQVRAFKQIKTARLEPQLRDLGELHKPSEILPAYEQWCSAMRDQLIPKSPVHYEHRIAKKEREIATAQKTIAHLQAKDKLSKTHKRRLKHTKNQVATAQKILQTLHEGHTQALAREYAGRGESHAWLRVIELTPSVRRRCEAAIAAASRHKLSVEDAWTLCRTPCDEEGQMQLVDQLAAALKRGHSGGAAKLQSMAPDAKQIANMHLEAAEYAAGRLVVVRWFYNNFPQLRELSDTELAERERLLAQQIDKLVSARMNQEPHGCRDCRGDCAPWLEYCDSCYQRSRFGWFDEDEDGDWALAFSPA